MTLSADQLLAGSALTHEVEVPSSLLPGVSQREDAERATVVLRPLTVRDLQQVANAAREQDQLASVLTVQRALVEPRLGIGQVAGMHAGLVQFLLGQVMDLSGLTADGDALAASASEPLARAAFALSDAFGWTPEEIQGLTLGQVLLHLEMLEQKAAG